MDEHEAKDLVRLIGSALDRRGVDAEAWRLRFQALALELGLRLTFDSIEGSARVLSVRMMLEYGQSVRQVLRYAPEFSARLEVPNIRIVPLGSRTLRFEVPLAEDEVTVVPLGAVLNKNTVDGDLPIAIGQSISNEPIVADLATLPHLLIGGQTGSGKSVALQGMLLSLMLTKQPNEVRLFLVDPKQVDLQGLGDSPFTERTATTIDEAFDMVNGLVAEMDVRYSELKLAGVQNLAQYNAWASTCEGEPSMPYLVLAVDELANLFMSSLASEMTLAILRLAQMGRAAGIHLLCATQRPVASLIPTTLRSQLPARLAFAMASASDSRVVLDRPGAEKLCGRGDGLFVKAGAEPQRIQAPFVTTLAMSMIVHALTQYFGEGVA